MLVYYAMLALLYVGYVLNVCGSNVFCFFVCGGEFAISYLLLDYSL